MPTPDPQPDLDVVIRAADWRFLLPEPWYARACVLGDAAEDRALGASLAATDLAGTLVKGADARSDPCDLVVVRDPDARGVAEAHARVRPGGTLYFAWRQGMRRGRFAGRGPSVRGVRRLLRNCEGSLASPRAVALYAPWPRADAAQAWLPLAERRAVLYYFARHPRPGRHPVRRLLGVAERVRGLMCMARGIWPAVVAVITVEHPAGSEAAASGTRAGEHPNSPWWLRDVPEQPDVGPRDGWVLFTPGTRAAARVLAFVLDRRDARPRVAVKLARTAESFARLGRAAETLCVLTARGPVHPGLAPRHLWSPPPNGNASCAGEEAIAGRALDAAVRRRSLPRYAAAVTGWAIALAERTRGADSRTPYAEFMAPAVGAFLERYGDGLDPALRDEALAVLRGAGPLPTVCVHGDLRPWNFLVTRDGRLVAVDWDGALARGLPLADLLPAVAFLHFALDGTMTSHAFGRSYAALLDGPSRLRAVRTRALARYADALGLSADALRVLRVFAWVGACVVDYEERAAVRRLGARGDWARSLLPVWEAEARRALRGGAER